MSNIRVLSRIIFLGGGGGMVGGCRGAGADPENKWGGEWDHQKSETAFLGVEAPLPPFRYARLLIYIWLLQSAGLANNYHLLSWLCNWTIV